MNSKFSILALACGVGAILAASAFAQDFSPDELAKRTIERRAVEAVIWGMPAVNAELMSQAAVQAKAGFNQVVYWSRPASRKNQTLTPNSDTIYLNGITRLAWQSLLISTSCWRSAR